MGCSEVSLSLYDLAGSDSPWGLFALANPSDVPIPVDGFLGFPYLSAFAKLSIVLVCLANEILENLDFPVYFCELVCVLPIVHDASPPTRILLCLPKMPYGSSDRYLPGKQIGSSASENLPELCRMIELQPSARPPRPRSVADFKGGANVARS